MPQGAIGAKRAICYIGYTKFELKDEQQSSVEVVSRLRTLERHFVHFYGAMYRNNSVQGDGNLCSLGERETFTT